MWDQIYSATTVLRIICYSALLYCFTYQAVRSKIRRPFRTMMAIIYGWAIVISIATLMESPLVDTYRALQTLPLIIAALFGLRAVYKQEF